LTVEGSPALYLLLELAMNIAVIVITLMVLEVIGLIQSVKGESAAEAGTYMFWIIALAVTVVVGTICVLLVQ
jgi:hypothetical protein